MRTFTTNWDWDDGLHQYLTHPKRRRLSAFTQSLSPTTRASASLTPTAMLPTPSISMLIRTRVIVIVTVTAVMATPVILILILMRTRIVLTRIIIIMRLCLRIALCLLRLRLHSLSSPTVIVIVLPALFMSLAILRTPSSRPLFLCECAAAAQCIVRLRLDHIIGSAESLAVIQ